MKDILAILLFLEFTIMFFISPDPFELNFLLMLLLPIGISSLVWNKWLYNGLMYNKESFYAKSEMSYPLFIYIGLFMVLISVISFGIAVWKWS